MRRPIALEPLLMTFARYGFRKASMEDLARASGVSRQALYNHFGSKAALADWVAQTLIDNSLAEALDCLENPQLALTQRLADALDAWVGQHMALMRLSPHGIEVAAMAGPAANDVVRGAERRLVAAITRAIRLSGPGALVPRAGSLAQALCWTASGLVHAVPDHASFRRQLDQIVGVLLAR